MPPQQLRPLCQSTAGVWTLQVWIFQGWFKKDKNRRRHSTHCPVRRMPPWQMGLLCRPGLSLLPDTRHELCRRWQRLHGERGGCRGSPARGAVPGRPLRRGTQPPSAFPPLPDGPGAEGGDQPHFRRARPAQEEAVHLLQHLPPALQLCGKRGRRARGAGRASGAHGAGAGASHDRGTARTPIAQAAAPWSSALPRSAAALADVSTDISLPVAQVLLGLPRLLCRAGSFCSSSFCSVLFPAALVTVFALELLYQPVQFISDPWELNIIFPSLASQSSGVAGRVFFPSLLF